jgi:hypothetical protein
MRADAHYVEQLDSTLFNAPVRFIDVHTLDSPRPDDAPAPSAAFVESIKRHGVLQPLLVRNRSGRHVVIAGRKRLAAAVAAGLREVPCLVERVDDEKAQTIAEATNVAAVDTTTARAPQPPRTADVPFGAFAECLTSLASAANLLSPGTSLAHAVAVDLVRAEAARALQLLIAMRIARGEAMLNRRPVSLRMLFERTLERTAAERRLRGLTLEIDVEGNTPATVWGDEELLGSAFATIATSVAVLAETPYGRTIALRAVRHGDESYAITAIHDTELPHHWRSKLAEESSEPSIKPGEITGPALVMMQAARRIAERHGGHMSLDCADRRTIVSLMIPIGR